MANTWSPWFSLFLSYSFFLFLPGSQLVASQACFGPTGDQTDSLACDPTAEDGPCCPLGWICLSNKLCRPGLDVENNGFVEFYRSDCTDQSWNTTACFSGCNGFGGNGLKSCGGGEFCCYNYDGCDCSSTSLFSLGAATFVTTHPTVMPTSTPVSSSATTTAILSASTTDASTTLSETTSSASSTGFPTETQQTVTEEAGSSNNEVAIGAGVGVGLGVPLLAMTGILAYILLRKRRTAAQPYAGITNAKVSELDTLGPRMEAGEQCYQLPAGSNGYSERYAHTGEQQPQEMDANARK
ncbi:hypothetical protein BS50DRAFT_639018 [Corynespora cassiicola Philippines]|uniref:Mid2 domain-containing protein n=1 Tax=Corynespora cassiicola Philippines TaxID=1448308 RepID=A0A2T2N8E2_CORCC|nr:hypothetical protein BS50DRAFT_639018 [Corynespora cassiicola Philippines]